MRRGSGGFMPLEPHARQDDDRYLHKGRKRYIAVDLQTGLIQASKNSAIAIRSFQIDRCIRCSEPFRREIKEETIHRFRN